MTVFYGCGGRTRTYDLRVMSPTSFQLLYSAIFGALLECLGIIAYRMLFVNTYFLSLSVIFWMVNSFDFPKKQNYNLTILDQGA